MKRLWLILIFYGNVKMVKTSETNLPIPSCERRTAIVAFDYNDGVLSFLITVGMKLTDIEKSIQGKTNLTLPTLEIQTLNGPELPVVITQLYLQSYYPNNKNIELQVIFKNEN